MLLLRSRYERKVMWYIIAAIGGAIVGVFLVAILVAGEDDYIRGYRKGFEDGKNDKA